MNQAWYLEGIASDGTRIRHRITSLPMGIGREPGNDMLVEGASLSRRHARIDAAPSGRLCLTDLGSTNGTFVNRERIAAPHELSENDVLHFGNAEFRLGIEGATTVLLQRQQTENSAVATALAPGALTEKFERHERSFLELLAGRGMSGAAQPIVNASDGSVFAYELLGRCTHPEFIRTGPVALFLMAGRLGREAELSAAFRNWGVRAIGPRLNGAKVFVNTHPTETFSEAFFAELVQLREQPGGAQLVVEVHETAVVEVEKLRELAARLAGIDVPFAYDDFGAGQSRLNELIAVPPNFVKFDMGLIRDLHKATEIKQRMVRDLVRTTLDVGSVPLAEGVEVEEEAQLCRDMGFQLIQGYFTGRPQPIDTI